MTLRADARHGARVIRALGFCLLDSGERKRKNCLSEQAAAASTVSATGLLCVGEPALLPWNGTRIMPCIDPISTCTPYRQSLVRVPAGWPLPSPPTVASSSTGHG